MNNGAAARGGGGGGGQEAMNNDSGGGGAGAGGRCPKVGSRLQKRTYLGSCAMKSTALTWEAKASLARQP